MKVLILSKQGDGLGIAHRLAREGHSVSMWIEDKKYEDAGVGIVERPSAWKPVLPKADLVLCDMVGFGKFEPLFKSRGKPAVGCSQLGDQMELDRGKGMKVMEQWGIEVPPYKEFKGPDDARTLLSDWNEDGYVIKPSGNVSTDRTVMCRTPEVFEWALGLYDSSQSLIIQAIIVDAVEVSTEGWFNGSDWILPFNHTFEEKRLMEKGVGPMVGCMGNVVMAMKKPTKLVEQTLMKLTPLLRNISYKGPLDINCLVKDDKAYGLEFTARFGYDAIEALAEGIREPLGTILFDTGAGIKKELDVTNDYMLAVRITRSPYPADLTSEDRGDKGMPIPGLVEANERHVFLTDCLRNGNGTRYAATDGVLCKVTALGRSVEEARNRAYRTIQNLGIPGAQYRSDIGSRVPKDLEKLRSTGWM